MKSVMIGTKKNEIIGDQKGDEWIAGNHKGNEWIVSRVDGRVACHHLYIYIYIYK